MAALLFFSIPKQGRGSLGVKGQQGNYPVLPCVKKTLFILKCKAPGENSFVFAALRGGSAPTPPPFHSTCSVPLRSRIPRSRFALARPLAHQSFSAVTSSETRGLHIPLLDQQQSKEIKGSFIQTSKVKNTCTNDVISSANVEHQDRSCTQICTGVRVAETRR